MKKIIIAGAALAALILIIHGTAGRKSKTNERAFL